MKFGKQTLRGLLVVLIAFGDSNEENQWKIIFSSSILSVHTSHTVIKKPVALLNSNMQNADCVDWYQADI